MRFGNVENRDEGENIMLKYVFVKKAVKIRVGYGSVQ
jgi:hypothetical protein